VLELPEDVVLARGHLERRALLVDDLVDDRASLAEALVEDPPADPVAEALLELRRQVRIEPLRLAGLLAELVLCLADLHDLAVGELERLEQQILGDLVATGLDHRQAFLRADDDEVERARLLHLLERRVDAQLAVDPADADGAHRAEEGQRRDHQRRRGAVDAQDVVRGDHVRREDGADHLHLVLVSLRPQGPDRAVDHPRRQDRPLGRASFALEEAARDLPGGIHPLFDVDGQREEVGTFARLHPPLRCRQHHRLAGAHDDGAVRLLRELAALEGNLLPADLDRDARRALYCDAHLSSNSSGRVEVWDKACGS
jgi:hypothetical protein